MKVHTLYAAVESWCSTRVIEETNRMDSAAIVD